MKPCCGPHSADSSCHLAPAGASRTCRWQGRGGAAAGAPAGARGAQAAAGGGRPGASLAQSAAEARQGGRAGRGRARHARRGPLRGGPPHPPGRRAHARRLRRRRRARPRSAWAGSRRRQRWAHWLRACRCEARVGVNADVCQDMQLANGRLLTRRAMPLAHCFPATVRRSVP